MDDNNILNPDQSGDMIIGSYYDGIGHLMKLGSAYTYVIAGIFREMVFKRDPRTDVIPHELAF